MNESLEEDRAQAQDDGGFTSLEGSAVASSGEGENNLKKPAIRRAIREANSEEDPDAWRTRKHRGGGRTKAYGSRIVGRQPANIKARQDRAREAEVNALLRDE